ncbi:MAG: MFS transporter [Methylocystis sp.]|nr:MAG: MFS transporter [Methylocystis sp.]
MRSAPPHPQPWRRARPGDDGLHPQGGGDGIGMGADRKDDAQRRLSSLTAALYAIGGVQVAFFPLWLGARGLSGAEIATILAACPAIRILSNLIGARIGDARGDYGRLIILYATASAAIFVALGFAQGFWVLLAGVTALSFAQAPISVLNDGLVLGEAHRRRELGLPALNFSAVRGWGSASVLVFMLASGPLAQRLPADALIWIMTGVAFLSTAAGAFFVHGFAAARPAAHETPEAPQATHAALQRPLLFAAIIACAAMVQGSHGFLTVFASLHWAARGFDPTFISIAWATAMAAEVAFFMAAGEWFGGEKRAVFFLMIGAAGAILRWTIFANDPEPWGVLCAQALNPLSASAVALGAAYLIAELGGKAYTARVHGWLAAANGATLSAALYASGPLEAAFGQRGYLAMAAMAGAGLALSFAVAGATRGSVITEKKGRATAAARPSQKETESA